jgi:hypothetical protein
MTIRLRPHHLLCMLTYIGKGYTPAFTSNYDRIAARIGAGEDLAIVAGPDDICAPLLESAEPHCFNDSVTVRDARAAADVEALLGCKITPGTALMLDAAMLARLRLAFAGGFIRSACAGCEWSGLCDDVAASGFPDVRVVC